MANNFTDKIDKTNGVVTGRATGLNGLAVDAWGRQKVVNDRSLFHGIWTYDVPIRHWVEEFDGVERVPTSATSYNKQLKLISNSGSSYLRSKRHPRYQPNRGILYSASCWLDNWTSSNGTLYAVQRSRNSATLTTEETRQAVTLRTGTDLSKGNIFDIQGKWRGVGGIKFFINNEIAYTFENLGTLDNLSVSNPALEIGFECKNDGTIRFGLFDDQDGVFFEYVFDTPQETSFRCGCVDVTSEGGQKEGQSYLSLTSGMTNDFYATKNETTQLFGTVCIAFRIPDQIAYNGDVVNVNRDAELKRFVAACKGDEIIVSVFYTRNIAALNAVFDSDAVRKTGSMIDYIVAGTTSGGAFINSTLQTAYEANINNMELLTVRRADLDTQVILDNPDLIGTPFHISQGDMIFAVIAPDQGTKPVYCNFEIGEEI